MLGRMLLATEGLGMLEQVRNLIAEQLRYSPFTWDIGPGRFNQELTCSRVDNPVVVLWTARAPTVGLKDHILLSASGLEARDMEDATIIRIQGLSPLSHYLE